MLGAIAGDIIGSVYEANNTTNENFPLFTPDSTFTDDTVLTVAVADVLLHGSRYCDKFKEFYFRYPLCPYGEGFSKWAKNKMTKPYHSCGNGAAMRVSPIGLAFSTMDDILQEAKKSAEVTHNHPQGIKGAQAIAAAVFMAREEQSKEEIREFITKRFGYDLTTSLAELQKRRDYEPTCQETVPRALIAFLASHDFEDCIRKAILIGGESDTVASIAGSIAECFYQNIPDHISKEIELRLDPHLLSTMNNFSMYYACAI